MEPLDGIRVVDFTRLYPGPLATAWLSDYGADVIKVEQPGIGDFSRLAKPKYVEESIYFLDVNRNKRSVGVDLKSPEGKQVVRRLLATADILVESFRPGTMQKFGLAYDDIAGEFPHLVYVSVSGFGNSGPYSHIAGHDLSVTGVGGGLDFRRVGNSSTPPVIPPLPVSDTHGAMLTVMGTLLALRTREKTGRGQHVDIALVDAMAAVMNSLVDGSFLSDGRDVSAEASQTRLGVMPRYNVYQAKDGKWLTLGCLEPHLWARFCHEVGRPDWVERTESLENRLVDQRPDRAQLLEQLRALFRTRNRQEWVEVLTAADVACLPANSPHEVFNDPHVRARGLLHTVQHPTEGVTKTIAVPAKLSATPGSVKCPGPYLGEHTNAVLSELGYGAAELKELFGRGVLVADGRTSKA